MSCKLIRKQTTDVHSIKSRHYDKIGSGTVVVTVMVVFGKMIIIKNNKEIILSISMTE